MRFHKVEAREECALNIKLRMINLLKPCTDTFQCMCTATLEIMHAANVIRTSFNTSDIPASFLTH